MRRLCCWAGLLLLTQVSYSNEEDLFEVDDFLDPRELGAQVRPDGGVDYGGEFRYFDAAAGYIWDYQDRSVFTTDNKRFLTLGYHKYYGNSQINHRISLFESTGEAVTYRIKSEYAKYELRHKGQLVFRKKASLVVDDRSGDSAEVELAGSIFMELVLPESNIRPRGGFSLSYRNGNAKNTYRFMWNASSDLWQSSDGNLLLGSSFRFGHESAEGTSRLVPFRGKLSLEFRLNSRTSLQGFYAPAFQTGDGGFEAEFNHELGLMFYHMLGTSFEPGI